MSVLVGPRWRSGSGRGSRSRYVFGTRFSLSGRPMNRCRMCGPLLYVRLCWYLWCRLRRRVLLIVLVRVLLDRRYQVGKLKWRLSGS